jgi:hypothetical protein
MDEHLLFDFHVSFRHGICELQTMARHFRLPVPLSLADHLQDFCKTAKR